MTWNPAMQRACARFFAWCEQRGLTLSAIRSFEWDPASAVRGPKHIVKTGKTLVLDGAEWRGLIDNIPTKGGKQHAMPCHQALAEALHADIDAAGIADDRKGWLFRTSPNAAP